MLHDSGNPQSWKPKEEDDGEDWIVSYADMVTLLLCFFIIYFSEKSETQEVTVLEEITAVFSNENARPFSSGSQEGETGPSEFEGTIPKVEFKLRKDLNAVAGDDIKVGIERAPRDITIRIWETGMFKTARWELSNRGEQLLKKITGNLIPFKGEVVLFVEGHTDSQPATANKNFENNLSLSSLRAISAANVIIAEGFDETDVFVHGFGASQPLVDDRNDDGRFIASLGDVNRRIQIRILTQTDFADSLKKKGAKN